MTSWLEQFLALYKGLGPTLASLAPFVAINFATYDTLKTFFAKQDKRPDAIQSLLLGATAGIVAQTACYPLDTIRRRMQMKGKYVHRSSLLSIYLRSCRDSAADVPGTTRIR
jgi:hypothetical protein